MIKQIERAEGRRWQVYGRRAGRKVYIGTYGTRREAIAADEDHRTTQRRVRAGELPAAADGKRTLGEALDEWLEWVLTAQPRSYGTYASRVKNHIKPTLADLVLTKVTPRILVELFAELATRVGRKTIETTRGALGAAWRWFVRKGYVERGLSPVRLADLSEIPIPPARLVRWISNPRDVTRLLAASAESIRDLVAVLIGTGLRIDEALHLEWTDIDLERRTIHVHRGRHGAPKSGRARVVEIFDSVLPVLRAMKLRSGTNVRLWPSVRRTATGGERVRSVSGVHLAFKAALRRAGLDSAFRIHDMRHTFAGLYLTAGGDIYRLSQLLGHASVRVTERVYAHLARRAFEADRGRVAFDLPGPSAKVIQLKGRQQGDSRKSGR